MNDMIIVIDSERLQKGNKLRTRKAKNCEVGIGCLKCIIQ